MKLSQNYIAGATNGTIRFPFTPGGFSSPSDAPSYFSALISTIVTLGIIVAIIFFVVTFLLGAIKWITSGGDKVKSQEAQIQLRNAIIGMVALLVFWVIITFVETVFNIELTSIDLSILQL